MELESNNDAPTTLGVSSMNIKMTAKGLHYWDIKIYSDDLEEIKKNIAELENWARERYGNEVLGE